MTDRLPYIDALKAVGAQLIVLHHLAFYGPMTDWTHRLLPGLMVGHWQAPPDDGAITITRLPLQYLGGLKAQPLAASVVVLRYGEQVRTLARGQRLAPGIVLQDIDSDGLIFNNQGRRERLPWPPRPAVTGFKRQG